MFFLILKYNNNNIIIIIIIIVNIVKIIFPNIIIIKIFIFSNINIINIDIIIKCSPLNLVKHLKTGRWTFTPMVFLRTLEKQEDFGDFFGDYFRFEKWGFIILEELAF